MLSKSKDHKQEVIQSIFGMRNIKTPIKQNNKLVAKLINTSMPINKERSDREHLKSWGGGIYFKDEDEDMQSPTKSDIKSVGDSLLFDKVVKHNQRMAD